MGSDHSYEISEVQPDGGPDHGGVAEKRSGWGTVGLLAGFGLLVWLAVVAKRKEKTGA